MRLRHVVTVMLTGVALIAQPLRPFAQERAAPAMPKPTKISYSFDAFEQSLPRPISRAFDPALLARRISGHRREAANVDEQDQVRLPSSWWQPRLGYRPVTVAQMLNRDGGITGPAEGKLLVTRMKTEGVSAGFQVKDARGVKFALKFDPPDFAELPSGADVVVSYLNWAAGYNVPQNSIFHLRESDLEIAPDASYHDEAGHSQRLTSEIVRRVLAKAHAGPDGSYRVVASRFLPGKPLGEWEYRGRRADDPEDLIPHQLRREVRGLYLLYAWTNDTDCSARNTFDSWITEGGRSFVRHYLVDFNGALGAASTGPKAGRGGFEYLLDFGAAGTSLFTAGLKSAPWESAVDPGIPSVGFIESQAFDPEHWHPFLPNPAFDDRTERDLRWGARIIAAFTDEHIRAAVEMGQYSDPRAAEYLTRILIERRDKIARRWPPPPAGETARLIP